MSKDFQLYRTELQKIITSKPAINQQVNEENYKDFFFNNNWYEKECGDFTSVENQSYNEYIKFLNKE